MNLCSALYVLSESAESYTCMILCSALLVLSEYQVQVFDVIVVYFKFNIHVYDNL